MTEPISERLTDRRVALDSGAVWRASLLAGLALALVFTLFFLAWLLIRPLALLGTAIAIAVALAPLVTALERWLPRLLAILLLYLFIILVFSGLAWLVVPPIAGQGRDLPISAPGLVDRLLHWIDGWSPVGEDRITETLISRLEEFSSLLVSLPLAIISVTLELLLIFTMSLYWLLVMPSLRRWVLSLVPADQQEKVSDVLSEMGASIGGYIRGVFLNGLIVGVMTYVGLVIIGVPFPLVLGVLAGLGEFIPIAGPIIASIPAIGLALVDSPLKAGIVIVFYIAVQQLEGHILVPNVVGKQAHIPAILALFAILAGAALGSILRALIAIPIAGAARVIILRVVAPEIRRWTGADRKAITAADE